MVIENLKQAAARAPHSMVFILAAVLAMLGLGVLANLGGLIEAMNVSGILK